MDLNVLMLCGKRASILKFCLKIKKNKLVKLMFAGDRVTDANHFEISPNVMNEKKYISNYGY